LGAGGIPQAGQQAAEASIDDLYFALQGTSRLFVVAGMGAGTRAAADLGREVIGVVSLPFTFEGMQRKRLAHKDVGHLERYVTTLIEVDGDRLLRFAHNRKLPSVEQAFSLMAGALAWHVLARMI
jgi:cell division protein FtsZ